MIRSGSREKGQATLEYILVLGIILLIFAAVMQILTGAGLDKKIMKPITEDFRRAYQFGHPKAKGFEEPGGPDLHPRAEGGNNFRIFFNPKSN